MKNHAISNNVARERIRLYDNQIPWSTIDDGFCPPNGRHNKSNKNINGNWMYAVSVSAHGSTSCLLQKATEMDTLVDPLTWTIRPAFLCEGWTWSGNSRRSDACDVTWEVVHRANGRKFVPDGGLYGKCPRLKCCQGLLSGPWKIKTKCKLGQIIIADLRTFLQNSLNIAWKSGTCARIIRSQRTLSSKSERSLTIRPQVLPTGFSTSSRGSECTRITRVRSRCITNTVFVFDRYGSDIRCPSFRVRFDLGLMLCSPGSNVNYLMGVWSAWSCSRCGSYLGEASDVDYYSFLICYNTLNCICGQKLDLGFRYIKFMVAFQSGNIESPRSS
jgi:hypothetical protein